MWYKIYEFFDNIYWWIYRFIIYEVLSLPRRIKWFYKRGKYGFSDSDIWSLDLYLARIIPLMMEQFIEDRRLSQIEINKKTIKELTAIQTGFIMYHEYIIRGEILPTKYSAVKKNLKKSFELLYKHFDSLWV